MRNFSLSILIILSACGSTDEGDLQQESDGSTLDGNASNDAQLADHPKADGGVDAVVADPKPCGATEDCLAAVESAADWTKISAPSGVMDRCDLTEVSKYLAPAVNGAPLEGPVFINVKKYPYHLEFMRKVLPNTFGGLTPSGYYSVVLKRQTRTLWGGSIFKVVQPGQAPAYGFSALYYQGGGEELTKDDIIGLRQTLAAKFNLPLGYVPGDSTAIAVAQTWGSLGFPIYFPRSCVTQTGCTDPSRSCFVTSQSAPLCSTFVENESLPAEYQRRAELRLKTGEIVLPSVLGKFPADFVQEFRQGPAKTLYLPDGTGELEVSEEFGFKVYDLKQAVAANGVRRAIHIRLASSNNQPTAFSTQAGGGDTTPFSWRENMDTRPIYLADCNGGSLPKIKVSASFPNGDGFAINYRGRTSGVTSGVFAGSSLRVVTGADVTLGGQNISVTDPFRLVYAAEHHNWQNSYWIIFPQPIMFAGKEAYGLAVEQGNPGTSPPPKAIYTLDSTFAKQTTLTVNNFKVESADP